MNHYSQYGEQEHILANFEDCPPGKLLDIGAYHPTLLSNSRALIELGWKAVLIEPSPGPMRALLAEYGDEPRVTLIQAAVALQPGLLELHVTDDAVTTASEAEYQKWKTAGGFLGKLLIPVLTLEQIAYQFQGFDFISIDVEGHSAELFMDIMRQEWVPHVICVEHDNRQSQLIAAATKRNYKCISSDAGSCNLIFIR